MPVFLVIGRWVVTSVFLLLVFWFFLVNVFNENEVSFEVKDKFILVGLFFAGLITLFKSPVFYTGEKYFLGTIVIPIITFIIFTNVTLKENLLKIFINSLIIAGVALGLFSLYISIFILGSYNVRLSSFWGAFNIVAAFFMIIFFFNLLYVIYEKRKFYKLLYILCLAIIAFGIFLTQTRGVWLAISVSLLFYIIRKPKALVPSMFLIGVFVILFFPIFLNRFLSIRFFASDWSSIGRIQAWIASILIIKDNFLFGTGFDSFYKLKFNYMSYFLVDVVHSHNTYLRLLVEMGFFGFVFYMFFYLKAFIFSFISKKFYKPTSTYSHILEGLQLSFVGLSVAFMFEPYFSLYGNSTIAIWMLMSLSYNLFYKRNYYDQKYS